MRGKRRNKGGTAKEEEKPLKTRQTDDSLHSPSWWNRSFNQRHLYLLEGTALCLFRGFSSMWEGEFMGESKIVRPLHGRNQKDKSLSYEPFIQ